MSNIKNYLQHTTGIWTMFQFFDSYLKYGYKYETNNKVLIQLSSFYSQHIALGSTNNKKLSKNLFLTFSQQLYNALSLVNFDKVVFDCYEQRIYLISKSVMGDGINWPDIPPFILGIYLENVEKLSILPSMGKIDIKPYYFTDAQEQAVIDHKSFFSLDIYYLQEKESVYDLIPSHSADYYDLMDKTINDAIKKYAQYTPEFKGDYVETQFHQDLKKNGVFDDPKTKK